MPLLAGGRARWVSPGLAIHHFSDFVWHAFSDAFWDGFGIDFGTILEHLRIILSPKTQHWFYMFFQRFSLHNWGPETMDNSILTWYSRKNLRNHKLRLYMDCVSKSTPILALISCCFWLILHLFRTSIFGCIFGCVFSHLRYPTGSQMVPKIETKSSEKLKNRRCGFQFNSYVLVAVLTSCTKWMDFAHDPT